MKVKLFILYNQVYLCTMYLCEYSDSNGQGQRQLYWINGFCMSLKKYVPVQIFKLSKPEF